MTKITAARQTCIDCENPSAHKGIEVAITTPPGVTPVNLKRKHRDPPAHLRPGPPRTAVRRGWTFLSDQQVNKPGLLGQPSMICASISYPAGTGLPPDKQQGAGRAREVEKRAEEPLPSGRTCGHSRRGTNTPPCADVAVWHL